jgi:membrane fusion protein, heavy metal efflux system
LCNVLLHFNFIYLPMSPLKPLFVALLVLGINACKNTNETTEATTETPTNEISLTPAQIKSFGITIGSTDTQTVNEDLMLNGTIEVQPQQKASVSFPMAGFVRSVAVVSGAYVKKGQELATISSIEMVQLQQDYAQTKTQLQLQEQELSRQKTLVSEDVGARRRLQEAEAALNGSQAVLAGLEAKLSLIGLNGRKLTSSVSVVAPISGFVQNIHVNIGKSVVMNDVLFELVNTDQPVLHLKAFEKDIPQLQVGEAITVAINGQNLGAKISNIGQTFSTTDRTVEVLGTFSTRPTRTLVGQYITAKVRTHARSAVVLPEAAVVHEGELASVFVQINDNVFRKETVKLGIEQNGFIEIIPQKPLPPQKVVRAGAKLLAAELNKGAGEEE